MIDTLVAFGCSNTFGSETVVIGDNKNVRNIFNSFPCFLSQNLGIKKYTNYARPGASNLEIAYKIIQYIRSKKLQGMQTQMLVIGWTGDRRFPFMQDGEILTAMTHYNVFNTAKRIIKYKKAKKDVFRFLIKSLFLETELCIVLSIIIKLAITSLLEKLNIKYLTIPTVLYNNHDLYRLLTQEHNISCYDNDGKIVFDFQNFKKTKIPKLHLTREEHLDVANWLYKYTIDNSIIK